MPFVHITWLPKACRTAKVRSEIAEAVMKAMTSHPNADVSEENLVVRFSEAVVSILLLYAEKRKKNKFTACHGTKRISIQTINYSINLVVMFFSPSPLCNVDVYTLPIFRTDFPFQRDTARIRLWVNHRNLKAKRSSRTESERKILLAMRRYELGRDTNHIIGLDFGVQLSAEDL